MLSPTAGRIVEFKSCLVSSSWPAQPLGSWSACFTGALALWNWDLALGAGQRPVLGSFSSLPRYKIGARRPSAEGRGPQYRTVRSSQGWAWPGLLWPAPAFCSLYISSACGGPGGARVRVLQAVAQRG